MYVEFNIYFSDLNKDAQQRLMNLIDITEPSEMNWDMDTIPKDIEIKTLKRRTYEKSKIQM